jgi:hypothetical protein
MTSYGVPYRGSWKKIKWKEIDSIEKMKKAMTKVLPLVEQFLARSGNHS